MLVHGAVGAPCTYSARMGAQNPHPTNGRVDVIGLRVTGSGAPLGALALVLFLSATPGARAETLESALARAYSGNPTLGAQRASVRATDENVPRALALGRPRVTGTADVGAQYTETHTRAGDNFETT